MSVVDFEGPELNEEGCKSFLENVYYVSGMIERVQVEGRRFTATLSDGFCGDRDALVAAISELAQRTANSAPKKPFKIVDSNSGKVTNGADPYPLLVSLGEVKQTAVGVFVFQGAFLERMRALDGLLRDLGLNMGAREQYLPVTVPVRSLSACGYLSSFPQHAYFCTPVVRDYKRLQELGRAAMVGEVESHVLAPAETMLSPTVCYHCFETLRATGLEGNLMLTAVNQCHRHELKNAYRLSRLQTYTMREYVFYGDEAFVEATRSEILEKTLALLRDWNLRYRVVVASDPFFASGAEVKKAFQILTASKLELQAHIPHSDSWLAIASFNNHRQSLTEPFEISLRSGAASSGCVGYGYERLLYAIYAQLGLDAAEWPDALLRKFPTDVPAL